MRFGFAVAVAGGLVASAAPARAEHAAVVVTGGANAHARSVVTSAFASVLEASGWQLVGGIADRDLQALAACSEKDKGKAWACAKPIAKPAAIDRVVVVVVAPDAGDSELVLTASLVVSEGDVVRSREPCQRCSDATLEKTARGLATNIVNHAQRIAGTSLSIETKPSGARITVDGEAQGSGEVALDLEAGTHTVVVSKPGWVTKTRQVELAAGEQSKITIELVEGQGASGKPVWPLVLAGAGVGALVAGAVISLRVDPPPPTEPQPKYLYSGPGIALGVAGAVAIAAGVYLYATSSPAASGPTVAIGPGGTSVGWATTF